MAGLAMRKVYRLLGIPVWSVTIIGEPGVEEEEPAIGCESLTSTHQLSADDAPMFGFTPWTPHWVTEDDD
jgi:hypothetical protein